MSESMVSKWNYGITIAEIIVGKLKRTLVGLKRRMDA